MKITMKDIAVRSGVSPATVSRIINGNAPVDPEKREKVMQIVAAESRNRRWVGHRKKHRIRHIGMLLLSGSRFDIRSVGIKILNIVDHLPERYEFHVYPSKTNVRWIESQFLRGELDGLLLSGHRIKDPFLSFLLNRIPHVWLNSYQREDRQPVSLMGNEFAGKIAASYLIEHHCRKPAVLSFNNENSGLSDRISGFLLNCYLHQQPAREIKLNLPAGKNGPDELTDNGDMIESAVGNALDALSRKEFPDGIFSPEELLTPYLYRVFLKKRMKKYPRVISCNHTPGYLAGLYPRPASINLHPETLVKLAIDELVNRIEGGKPRPDNIATVIQPQLVPGEEI